MFAPTLDARGLLLLASLSALLLVGAAGCSDDSGGHTASAATGEAAVLAAAQSASPIVDGPVSQFAVLLEDLGIEGLRTDLNRTWKLTAEIYAKTRLFASQTVGLNNLHGWDYREGYESGMTPSGGVASLLDGAYIVREELHLFGSVDGADAAFRYFRERVRNNGVSEEVTVPGVGNEWIATRTGGGTIGDGALQVKQVLYQVIFRRGNVVAVMLTIGAANVITVDTAHGLSTMVDEKLLDARPHPSPTPIPERTTAADSTGAR